jgi:hypothetical protein
MLIAFIIIILIIIISFTSLQMEFKFIIRDGNNWSFMVVRLLNGLIRVRFNLIIYPGQKKVFFLTRRKTHSTMKIRTSPKEVFQLFKKTTQFYRKNIDYIEYLKPKVKVKEFSLMSKIGIGDAAGTALLAACTLNILNIIICHLRNYYGLPEHRLTVIPLFEEQGFELKADCIIDIKIGYIMFIGIRKAIDKLKGGEKFGRASY